MKAPELGDIVMTISQDEEYRPVKVIGIEGLRLIVLSTDGVGFSIFENDVIPATKDEVADYKNATKAS